jgi:hypothetical protein
LRLFKKVFVLLALWAANANSQNVIYNNGAPNNFNANNITYFIGAETFQFPTAQTVTAVRAWVMGASQFAGHIDWMIYADNSGQPGDVLSSGSQASVTFTATGASVGTFPVSQMDFNISSFAAAANTPYWLGIRNGPAPTDFPPGNSFDWVWTDSTGPATSYFYGYGCCGAPTGWYPVGAEHAFELLSGPSYSTCLLYDPTKVVKAGATIPIKLQLCNVSGNDLSSPSITLHAISITQVSNSISGTVEDAGNANPDNDFRFDITLGSTGGYIFNLKTTGLTTGTYSFSFTVTGDSFVYAAPFQVK